MRLLRPEPVERDQILCIKKAVLFDTLGVMISEQSRVTNSYKPWFLTGDVLLQIDDIDVLAGYERHLKKQPGACGCGAPQKPASSGRPSARPSAQGKPGKP